MNYVLLEKIDECIAVKAANRLALSATRSRDALVAFQRAVQTTLNDARADVIAIKDKPEKGGMSAGAAAMKMEGIVLANSPCNVEFISGKRINNCTLEDESIHKYLQAAFKSAAVILGVK